MIVYATILIAILLFLKITSQPRHLVHAARARPSVSPLNRLPLNVSVRDTAGETMDLNGRFLGQASGNSGVGSGIHDGSTIIGDILSPNNLTVESTQDLLGKIVVIDAMAKDCKTGLRLRKIKTIDTGGLIEFYPDKYGNPHTKRMVDTVCAVITHAT